MRPSQDWKYPFLVDYIDVDDKGLNATEWIYLFNYFRLDVLFMFFVCPVGLTWIFFLLSSMFFSGS